MAKLLIDGDILAYKASSSVQKDIDWGDGLFTCHAYLEDAIEQFRNLLDNILFALKETTLEDYSISDMIFFFSVVTPNDFKIVNEVLPCLSVGHFNTNASSSLYVVLLFKK